MTNTDASVDPTLLESLSRHLDGLKRTAHGAILYDQIERGLKKYGRENGRIEPVFVTFLYALLGKYAKDPACDPATRVKARLIQQRLTLYLPSDAPASPNLSSVTLSIVPPNDNRLPNEKNINQENKVMELRPITVTPETTTIPSTDRSSPPMIEPAEQALADPVTESIAVGQEFGDLLESERQALQNMESPLGDFNDLKQILVKGLNELIEERRTLIQKLGRASEYLEAVETDRQRLRTELRQARQHGLSDELTGLPKRDVFIRQLEAEIGRVKRYGFSLALAVIDVDGLDRINSHYGRAAGDAVMRCYAAVVLSKFRTYDLVARYGDDEFAVLFPNTQQEGAMHALEKAQKTAAGTCISYDGQNIPLPTFSSVLSVYAHGEKADALLKRADEALYHAKTKGQNQLVVALPAM